MGKYDKLPKFTRKLLEFADKHEAYFATPAHNGGAIYKNSELGEQFYKFFGKNVFNADISISVGELGSLLDHSGPHKDAEELISKVFGAEKSLIVTNGTSTSNKIVGMYAAGDNDTVFIDRNCHKSLAHFMMMENVKPIYMKPIRNAYGILGGIPESEFLSVSKLKAEYAVVTNSTYDGLFYNAQKVTNYLKNVPNLHFDSAWVAYTNFHKFYKGLNGLGVTPNGDQVIFETHSTHKLLAGFSQASMIHCKGDYDEEILNEIFMMHTSTSPLYQIVASCEVSAAIFKEDKEHKIMDLAIEKAITFRNKIRRKKLQSNDWYYDVWQADYIFKDQSTWQLKTNEKWHGFKNLDNDHLILDPIKVTILMPGISNDKLDDFGIPSAIVASYLESQEIVVEKTIPYGILMLFAPGVSDSKVFKLEKALYEFKNIFDQNLLVKEVLPAIYEENNEFYENMKIQELTRKLHNIYKGHDLTNLLFKAFDILPEQTMTPHQGYVQFIKKNTKMCALEDLKGKVAGELILPYPPGVPLLMIGEKITDESECILEYLLILQDIGKQMPGFDIDIHGLRKGKDGRLYTRIINVD